MRIFGGDEFKVNPISHFFNKSVQETKDEYYEMLQKISTHLVGYCLLTYFRDEIATVTS